MNMKFEIGSKVKVNLDGENHSVFVEGTVVTITEIGTLFRKCGYYVTDGQREQFLYENQVECI